MSPFKSKYSPKPFCKTDWKTRIFLLLVMVLLSLGWALGMNYEKKLAVSNFVEEEIKDTLRHFPSKPVNIANIQNIDSQLRPILERPVIGIFRNVSPAGAEFLGSGVIIHPKGYLFTNRHFVKPAGQLFTQYPGLDGVVKLPLEIIKVDVTLNVALLKVVSTMSFPYLITDVRGTVNQGDPVFAVGKSEVSRLLMAPGQISVPPGTITIAGKTYPVYYTDTNVTGLYSGGPLVNTLGRIIGINIATQKGVTRKVSNYSIPIAQTIDAFTDVIQLPKGYGTVGIVRGMTANPGTRNPDVIKAVVKRSAVPAQPAQASWSIWGFHPADILGLLILGFLSGMGGGMLTMGGGIIKVSGLFIFFEYGMVLIRPVAYLTNIIIYGASSYNYHIGGLVQWDLVKRLVPAMVFGFITGYIGGSYLDVTYIKFLLAVFALYSGTSIFIEVALAQKKNSKKEKVGVKRNNFWKNFSDFSFLTNGDKEDKNFQPADIWYGYPMGIVCGALGISGGVVEVPIQKGFLKVPLRNAIANTSSMALYCSMLGSLLSLVHGAEAGAFELSMPFFIALFIIPGAFLGSSVGTYLTKTIPINYLKACFVLVLYAIAAKLIFL